MDELPKVNEVMQMLRDQHPELHGKLVVIDEESGEYIIGDEIEETVEKAKQRHPSKFLHLRRVGGPVYFIGGAA